MRKQARVGDGTLLPSANQVNQKKSPSKRKVGKPGAADGRQGKAAAVPPVVTTVSDKRITRLMERRDLLLLELFTPSVVNSEFARRWKMEEFELTVLELAALKARRNAQPVSPYTVTLDEHASRLVRSIMADDPDFTVEDVVNGCVYFNADDEHTGSPECFEAARDARLGKEVA